MPRPTHVDLGLRDTPALAVLSQHGADFPGIEPGPLHACQDLLRVAKRSLAAFGDEFARHGISPGRYSLLMELYASPAGLPPSELAARVGVTRATVTGLVEGLLQDGLVMRARIDEADRRRKDVRLSAKGGRLLGRLLPQLFARMVGLVGALTPHEQRTLQRLLHKIESGPLLRNEVQDG